MANGSVRVAGIVPRAGGAGRLRLRRTQSAMAGLKDADVAAHGAWLRPARRWVACRTPAPAGYGGAGERRSRRSHGAPDGSAMDSSGVVARLVAAHGAACWV